MILVGLYDLQGAEIIDNSQLFRVCWCAKIPKPYICATMILAHVYTWRVPHILRAHQNVVGSNQLFVQGLTERFLGYMMGMYKRLELVAFPD